MGSGTNARLDAHTWRRLVTEVAFGALLIFAVLPGMTAAQKEMLWPEMSHVRSGEEREWSDFPEQADNNRIVVAFESKTNDAPACIGLRRIDVKEPWQILLNGERISRLFSDENDMEEVFELPPNSIKDGANELIIEPTSDRVDDVMLGEIWIDHRDRKTVLSEASLSLTATDASGHPIPCRFTIVRKEKGLAAIGNKSSDELAVRSGVVYSGNGTADVLLQAGDYTVYCGRGFEYEIDQVDIQLAVGQEKSAAFQIARAVDTGGLVACDTHVHTFEISRHGDATLVERMITLAGEGIELAIATDHNVHVDYRPYLSRLGLDEYLTSAIGNEVTTRYGHFNVFPATPGASTSNHEAESWPELFKSIYSTPGIRVAIINHARDVHSGFTPFAPENMIAATGRRLDERELEANGMELINSAALQSDPTVLFHDWMALLNRGHDIIAVGSSDSHEVSRKIVGQGRTYIVADDSNVGAIDLASTVENFVDGKALISFGLLTEIEVNGRASSGELLKLQDEAIRVNVRVQGPSWVTADRVELYMNGIKVIEKEIDPATRNASGLKAEFDFEFATPRHDLYFVAVARGPGDIGLFWPIAKPYQPASPTWEPYVFGASGVVRVEADGDGRWSSAYEYATRIVDDADGVFTDLVDELGMHQMIVALFAAEAWAQEGHSLVSDAEREVLNEAPDYVQQGFRNYLTSLRNSLDARVGEYESARKAR